MATLYKTDFYGWTQDQAAKLRALLVDYPADEWWPELRGKS